MTSDLDFATAPPPTKPSIRSSQNISREELVLRRIMDDPIIQNKVLPHLEPKLFSDTAHQDICTAILECHEKYNAFPQQQDLKPLLPENSIERNRLIKIMNYKVDDINKDIALDIIETFFKERKTEEVLVNAAEFINDRDFKNIGAIIKDLEESVNFSLHTDIGINLVDDTEEALRRLNETYKAIPSGLEELRMWTCGDGISGGYYPKALTVFNGMPNVGKTILLCNEAAYAYASGYNVLYVTLEMSEEHIWEKIACNITDIPIYKIKTSSAGDVERLLRENKEHGAEKCGNMDVRQMTSTTTCVEIESLINEIRVAKGYNVDILFVDYIGKMKAAKRLGGVKTDSLHTQGTAVAEQLRDVAINYTIPVVTASQVNREGYTNIHSDMSNTAGSAGVNDTADLMVTITQDAYLKKYNMYLHTIIKSRFGPNMQLFLSCIDYSHMRVRSASTDQVDQYRNAMIEQNIEIAGHNREDTNYGTTKSESDVSKEEKEKNRLESIKQKLIEKEKNILEDSETIEETAEETSGEDEITKRRNERRARRIRERELNN